MNRIIGLDIGEKRIGVAISDALNIIATPISTLGPHNIYLDNDGNPIGLCYQL